MLVYNLTDDQKQLIRWLVEEVRAGNIPEEFLVTSSFDGCAIVGSTRIPASTSGISKGALDAMEKEGLIIQDIRYKTSTKQQGKQLHQTQTETSRRCSITGRGYEAVDNDFNAPDTSFVRYLTPLADITNFDQEIKNRCLPILGAGSNDPLLWDSAVRTVGVILEERLRDVGGIIDPNRTGQNLVNDVFNDRGPLADKFSVDSERKGYRDLYAGIVGAFRNPSAHRLIDPDPEEGGAFIVFVNLLLKKLDLLR